VATLPPPVLGPDPDRHCPVLLQAGGCGFVVRLGDGADIFGKTEIQANLGRRYAYLMRSLRYSINVTLDGCCDPVVILKSPVRLDWPQTPFAEPARCRQR
jgi:hypothetical protein